MYVNVRLVVVITIGVFLGAAQADARTRANPSARVVRDLSGHIPFVELEQRVPSGFVAGPAPLPTGAVPLDSTYYDVQDMGSLGARIVREPDGTVHVVFMDDFCELDAGGCPPNLSLPNPFPERAMSYMWRSPAGVWSSAAKTQDPGVRGCCVTEVFGGFGSLDVTSTGRAAVAAHMNEDGCDLRGDLYLQDTAGGTSFSAYLGEITANSYLFPQITANSDGSFSLYGEVPAAGIYDEVDDFRLAYLSAEGGAFVCPTGWQFSAWKSVASVVPPSLFQDGRPAFPSISKGADGRVGLAFGDFGGNVFLLESSDGTFNTPTLTLTQITNYTDAMITVANESSLEYRPYVNCDIAYNGNDAHVVWSELQARRESGQIFYYDYRSKIKHWSAGTGITTVKQVQAGEADTYDDVDNGATGPLSGFNTISVDWPQVGFSDSGNETIVAWLRFVDAEIDPTADAGLPGIVNGIGYGDIAGSVSVSGGAWSSPQNFTETPITDERFFSIPERNPNGKVQIIFQASATDEAGVAAIGDRGAAPGNLLRRVAFLERDLAGVVTAVTGVTPPALDFRIGPNPTSGPVRFMLAGANANDIASVSVYAVNGARVAQLDLQGGAALWNGLDAMNQQVPTGVYFAKLNTQSGVVVRKFVVVR